VGESFQQNVAERAASLIANAYTLGGATGSGGSGLTAMLARLMFLSKTDADTAKGHITFENGLTAQNEIVSEKKLTSKGDIQLGKSFVGGLNGIGGKLKSDGSAELRSLKLWEFLEVPELRYNSVSVYTGIRWDTFGAGLIESVEIDTDADGNELTTGTITLHLEDGQIGAIAVDDLCMGIYHDFNNENESQTRDSRTGVFTFAGFNTCYFRITEILNATYSQFKYELRAKSDSWDKQIHPSAQMNFACYANPSDTERQWCVYTTNQYSIGLRNMTSWEYDESNIYRISGLLDGFSLSGKDFEGVGDVLGNAYIYGSIEQFDNAPLELNVSVEGNNLTLGEDESVVMTCTLTQGWKDLTDTVKTWSITRESGDNDADTQWASKAKVKNFKGKIEIAYEDISVSDSNSSVMFTISATTDDTTVKVKTA
jgi:hypothetical protein